MYFQNVDAAWVLCAYVMSLFLPFILCKCPEYTFSYVVSQFIYSETCVRKPPLRLTLMVDVERWLSYKGTYHVILLAKLHDMYLYKTATFPHQPSLFKVCLIGGSLTQVSLYSVIHFILYLS